jgi:prepilin-type N-terminal cleavage/methylation domain-containing protein
MIHSSQHPARAFTLIEMMVSVAIFSVVMVIVGAAYLNLINLDQQARAVDEDADNISFVIDSMARAIRTGTSYNCDQSGALNNYCASTAGNSFSFTDSAGEIDTYILSNNRIGECLNYSSICTSGVSAFQYITSPDITVTNLSFYVRGAPKGDNLQPQVMFSVTGKINSAKATQAPVSFTIESSATQRAIDL